MTRRRKLTQHLPYTLVIEKLSKHFHRLTDVRRFIESRFSTISNVLRQDDDTGPDTPFETIKPDPLSLKVVATANDSSSDDP